MATSDYKPTIGLEIHAELKTATKMFSPSKNDPDEVQSNVNIHPIDLGHPGTLPTINKKAVEQVIRVGLAAGGEIANFTEFDRKNYFYPDIPKGYQISQYAYPIVSGGMINDVELTRIHLEEDTGTSKHDQGNFSLVDYNRAGVPLMELVTEPAIHSAEQAVSFAKMLQLLLRYLGAGDVNMEKGEMRVEANISVSKTDELGTKVEIKNLNSFKVVEKAIDHEIKRMIALHEAGRADEIVQETRGWDENAGRTFSQRKKESSDDYRYFPEPDLPKMNLHEVFDLEKLKAELPELPWEKKQRLVETYVINEENATMFVIDTELGAYFDEVAAHFSRLSELDSESKSEETLNQVQGVHKKSVHQDFVKLATNYLTSDVAALRKEGGTLPSTEHFSKLITMILENKISSRGAKDTLAIMMKEDGDPEEIAKKEGLLQQSDEGAIEKIVDQIIAENEKAVEEFKAGKEASLQFLIGQGMRLSKGSANPQVLRDIFQKKLQ